MLGYVGESSILMMHDVGVDGDVGGGECLLIHDYIRLDGAVLAGIPQTRDARVGRWPGSGYILLRSRGYDLGLAHVFS
jgi:hypothetical protein